MNDDHIKQLKEENEKLNRIVGTLLMQNERLNTLMEHLDFRVSDLERLTWVKKGR